MGSLNSSVKHVKDQEALPDLAESILQSYSGRRVFAFTGELGSGKTTFIKSICQKLGVEEMVNSPTFALINVYETNKAEPVYHFDFYRIRSLTEALDLGFMEYIDSGHYCFIEWPEVIKDHLPANTVNIRIKVLSENSREFAVGPLD